MNQYPDDADGDALRKVAKYTDMSKPVKIDYVVVVPDEASGHQVERLASERGYLTVLECDEVSGEWVCYCSMHMLPTYVGVVAAQAELDELSAPFGGHSDGWGTFGNLTE